MTGRTFRDRLLKSTRGKILTLIRAAPRTVSELAVALSLSDNAVRNHLTSLERDGLVRARGTQPGIRRPHVSYELAADAEMFFPKAYGSLLNQFVSAIAARLPASEFDAAMRDVGRAVARLVGGGVKRDSRDARLTGSLDVLSALGGAATLREENRQLYIRGANCPLSAVTTNHPQACVIAEAMLAELIGSPVTQCCVHGGQPQCCFRVSPVDGDDESRP